MFMDNDKKDVLPGEGHLFSMLNLEGDSSLGMEINGK